MVSLRLDLVVIRMSMAHTAVAISLAAQLRETARLNDRGTNIGVSLVP